MVCSVNTDKSHLSLFLSVRKVRKGFPPVSPLAEPRAKCRAHSSTKHAFIVLKKKTILFRFVIDLKSELNNYQVELNGTDPEM